MRFLNIILLLLLISLSAHAQNSYRFRTLSPKGGFYYDGVQDIMQDNDGFIWILLENDLQRFDGYEYKRYSSYFRNSNIPNIWKFRNLFKDSFGCLYVSTNNGFFQYNKSADSFEKIIDRNIFVLSIDRKNNIWCRYNGELYRINRGDTILEPLFYEQKNIKGIGHFSYGENDIYFCSNYNRVYYCNYKEPDKISLFHLFPHDYALAGIQKTGGYLWILTKNHGIVKFNISTKAIEKQFQFQGKDGNNLPRTMYVDKNNHIWIGMQRGLYVLDSETGEYRFFLHSESDAFSLPNNSIWTITGDSHQNVWIGTYAGGLCHVNLDEKLISKTYTPSENALNHNLVSSFAEDGNLLWIGTEGGGLNCLNRQTGAFTFYKHEENNNSLFYNNIKSLALDCRKRLWTSMYIGGLDCFDTKTKKFQHFRHDPENPESLYENSLRKIILEEGGLWIAYQTNRLLISYFSFETGKFTHYSLDENSYIFDIQKDNHGNLYLITHEQLYRMDVKIRSIENISPTSGEILNAQSLCVDADNNVWIGTIGHGLIKYDPNTSEFIPFPDILHFNISTIYSICPDATDCLWLGTDNGLFMYNIKDNSYQRFDESDGFQGQVYYPLASLKGSNGELYFGGTNGFTIVNPKDIKPNMFKPKVIISDFYIDNIPAIPKFGTDTSNNEIILNYDQANFGFKFSSDNYLLPGKNRFKYRLKEYDNRWITVDASNRTVMYSKVSAGTYYFEIIAANNDGIWSDSPTTVKIIRKSAPWASWPAYLLYSMIVLGIAGFISYHYYEKRKLKLQLYIDNLDKQKKEEIHQSQLRFFTNISHDFRTPLSLILAAMDNLKQEGLKEYYYRILHNNASRLLNLVNELMDFRTVENGKMQLQVQPVDVNRLVTGLASDFKDYAKKRNIKYEIVCDPEMNDTLYVDKQIVEKAVMNLLNNAFKYTKDGGEIRMETHSGLSKFSSAYTHNYNVPEDQNPENGFLLVVRDTGIGISKDSIKNVFDRYYQVNTNNLNQHLGTGIGLALVKSLILLHKGTISIFSEREKGTDIVISLPADKSIYSPSEYAEMEKNVEQSVNNRSISDNNPHAIDGMDNVLRRDKKRILIVEDNNDLRTLLSGFLSKHYEIVEAENGLQASGVLSGTDIDLILCDIMMPLKDGVTLCREVKSDVNTSHIPFILLTAKTGLESKIESAGSGADVYFEKPLDFNLLLLSIQNIFKRQQNLREYYAKNYYVDSAELSANEQDNTFLKKLIKIIDANLNQPNIDVNYIASELLMSRSKLYSKVKTLTDKSIVEFILNYRLRKAARLIIEEDMSMLQVMEKIGLKSQSYFTGVFKKEFGETPTAFAAKHRKA